jgi:hypothetical protein
MVLIALCSALIGATLSTQYKVPALFPAAMMGVALVTAVAALKGSTVSATISALAIWTICLQLGYLGGLLTRYCLEATGLAPRRWLHSPIARN